MSAWGDLADLVKSSVTAPPSVAREPACERCRYAHEAGLHMLCRRYPAQQRVTRDYACGEFAERAQ